MKKTNVENLKGRKINIKTNAQRDQNPLILPRIQVVQSPAQALAHQEVHSHQEH